MEASIASAPTRRVRALPEAAIAEIAETAVAYGARAFPVFDADGVVREICIWTNGGCGGCVCQTWSGLFEAWHDEADPVWKMEKRVRRAVGRAIYGVRFCSAKLPSAARGHDGAAEAPDRLEIQVPVNGAFQESPFYAAF